MEDRSSIGKESIPELSEMNFILSAKRVYEELGSKKSLNQLMDSPPKLLLEEELELRLHSKDGTKRLCKIFIFDKILIVASLRKKRKNVSTESGKSESYGLTSGSSSDGQVVWFGDKKSSDMSSESSSEASSEMEGSKKTVPTAEETDSDSDDEADEEFELDRAESEDRRKKKRYNLKMWIDLCKVKPRFSLSGSMFAIMITYVSKTQIETAPGEVRYETTVDQAEIWLDNEHKAKNILGIIQEAVNKNAQEVLDSHGKQPKKSERGSMREQSERSDTENSASDIGRNSTHSTGSSNSGKTRRARKNLQRGKEALRATQAFLASTDKKFDENGMANHPGVLTLHDIKDRYEGMSPGKADHDEGLDAEYTVSFKNAKLGFALTSNSKIGPFVCRLVQYGLAETCGVALGDRVTAINDTEIQMDTTWNHCVDLIKKANISEKNPLTVSFLRKQKNEINRQQKEEEMVKAKEAAVENPPATEEDNTDDGEVLPVDESREDIDVDGTKKNTDRQTIELRRKTDDGSMNPKFTIKRKRTGKRRFAKKNQILQNMRYQVTNMKDYADFKKNKAKMFELFENVDSLFLTVLGYLKTDREKTCVHSLKEIYDTEYKYNTELNALREFHVKLTGTKKNVICKHLKTGRPFCEHRRPLRFCTQPSSFREPAVDSKEVDGIFLNVKPIMKSNVYLWKNLQAKLGVLYDKLKNEGKNVEVHELLEVFCTCFTEIAPFLQIYWQYCMRYTSACEKQKSLRASNEYFLKIVEPLEKKHKTKLPNLLSKPVQRITRYHLLFTTLRDYTKKYIKEAMDKGDFDEEQSRVYNSMTMQLEKACTELVSLAQKVNVKVGEAESLDQMVEVYGEIGGKEGVPNLLQPHRRFISKTPVSFGLTAEEVDNDCILYLFNDMLAIASIRSKRSPSVFAGGSKLSFPLRKLKNLSVGKDRASSITGGKSPAKKISLMSGSSPNDLKSKRMSVRAPKKTSNGKDSKKSAGSADSKDTKDDFYEVVLHLNLKELGNIKLVQQTGEEDVEYFGLECIYARKDATESEVNSFQIWSPTTEKREEMRAQIVDLTEKDKEKRSKLHNAQQQHGGKKQQRKRKFKKKHDKYKKESLEKGKDKAKSSLYSNGESIRARKAV